MAFLLLSWFTWWDEKAIWEVKIFPYKEKFKNKTFQIQGEVNRPSFNPCTQDPRILNPRIKNPRTQIPRTQDPQS